MRTVLCLTIPLVLLSSCSTDGLVPCEKEGGTAGMLCREYLYYNDDPVGYAEFGYQGDSATVTSFFDVNEALQKTVTEKFKDGRTIIVTERFPDGPSRIQSWHYNGMDSLSAIMYGANDSLLEITYENGMRRRENLYRASILDRYSVYRYFQDGGELYRISVYDADDSLTSYRNYEYFSNGKSRVNYFTSDNRNIGYRLYRSTQAGLTASIEFIDSTGTVTESASYLYDSGSKLVEKTESDAVRTKRSLFLYY